METELKETIQNLLLQFMQNMHEWEVMCNDIAKQSKLSFEEQFNKQKELVSKIFLTSALLVNASMADLLLYLMAMKGRMNMMLMKRKLPIL